MTRKDYELIARALHDAKPLDNAASEWDEWDQCVALMANALVDTNPRFDRGKFETYCVKGAYK